MKLIRYLESVVSIKKTIGFICLSFMLTCSTTEEVNPVCLEDAIFFENSKMLFYLCGTDDSDRCFYMVCSSCLDKGVERRSFFDGDKLYISFSSMKYNTLLSFADTIGTERFIDVVRKWKEGRRLETAYVSREKVVVQNIFYRGEGEIVVLLLWPSLFYASTDLGYLDGMLFISNKKGFIGSYLSYPINHRLIIAPVGDILKDKIDYSKFTFGRLL